MCKDYGINNLNMVFLLLQRIMWIRRQGKGKGPMRYGLKGNGFME